MDDAQPDRVAESNTPPIVQPAADLIEAVSRDLDDGAFGIVAALMHEGELRLLNAFGAPDETSLDQLTVDATFAFPSFTEVLIGTLSSALHANGVLDMDAPISELVSDLDEGLGRTTLRQLMSHRAGLDNAAPRDSTAPWPEVLAELDGRALFTEPGSVYSYSRYSYGLAVRAVESATGRTLEDALSEAIFAPLALQHTYLGPRDEERALDGLPVTYTSATDLLRFWDAWLNGQVRGARDSFDDPLVPSPWTLGGRIFDQGVWIEETGGIRRLTLMCAGAEDGAAVQVFPASGSILVAFGRPRWPRHVVTFLLSVLAPQFGLEDELFAPRRYEGGGSVGQSERRCPEPAIAAPLFLRDFGPPTEPSEWSGRYVNGEWFFDLEERDGILVSPRGAELQPYRIHHFQGAVYFAVEETPIRGAVGYPLRLGTDRSGRRYVMLNDRAYLHQADANR